jgi:sortase A
VTTRDRVASFRRGLRLAGTVVLLSLVAWHGGRAAWIEAKARLAQVLVRRAWRQAAAGDRDARPRPWADTTPVARLLVPGRGIETFVLAGASGRTLAFGPGHLDGTPLPGARGNAVISGHRDTHFAFLRRLGRGEAILVEDRDGRRHRFVVASSRVVDRRDLSITLDAGDTRLTLVTCFPFDAIRPGGPLRYVVVARSVEGSESAGTRRATAGESGMTAGVMP